MAGNDDKIRHDQLLNGLQQAYRQYDDQIAAYLQHLKDTGGGSPHDKLEYAIKWIASFVGSLAAYDAEAQRFAQEGLSGLADEVAAYRKQAEDVTAILQQTLNQKPAPTTPWPGYPTHSSYPPLWHYPPQIGPSFLGYPPFGGYPPYTGYPPFGGYPTYTGYPGYAPPGGSYPQLIRCPPGRVGEKMRRLRELAQANIPMGVAQAIVDAEYGV